MDPTLPPEEPPPLDELEAMAVAAVKDALWIDPTALRRELRLISKTRVSTGIPTLDLATKGGLPGGTVTLLVGPEGSCKTAFAVQLGISRARKIGKVCYAYMPDQGGTQPLARLADTFGDITDDEKAFARFAEEIGPFFRVFDERLEGVTLETFRDAVLAADDVGAVIIDTPQTVSVNGEEDERRVIDFTMGVARKLASKLTTHVLVPSHANRASTAARKKEDRTMERSAGLGSAKLGHRSQVVMFMEKRENNGNEGTEIDVLMTKVSYGRSGSRFRLLLNVEEWTLAEVDFKENAEADQAREENHKTEKKATEKRSQVAKILEIVDAAPADNGVSLTRIRDSWGGRPGDLSRVLALMVEDGALEPHLGPTPLTGGKRPRFYHRKEQ